MIGLTIKARALLAATVAVVAAGSMGLSGEKRGPRPIGPGVPPMVIGMNLSRPSYYSSDWPFADVIRGSAALFTHGPTGAWVPAEGVVELDELRRPVNVPASRTLIVPISMGSGSRLPGPLSCSISPGWLVKASRAAQVVAKSDTRFDLVPSSGGKHFSGNLNLDLSPIAHGASLAELSCLVPGAKSGERFNPDYLEELRPFKIARFMEWMKINDASTRAWAERPRREQLFADQSKDVPIEDMIALANEANVDPWFTMPLDADAEYYRNFAMLVRQQLKPGLKAYVELSNEVWNRQFRQARDATNRGLTLGLASDARTAGNRYYADSVRGLMKIWTEVFASEPQRLVRVAAAQAAATDSSEAILAWKSTWQWLDALATAPYMSLPELDLGASPEGAARLLLEDQADKIVEAAIASARAQKAVAAKYGLKYLAYEGGQHFASPDANLRETLVAVNRDPRMERLYTAYLNRWRKEIGGPLVLLSFISGPGPGGSWGHKEYQGQPLSSAPKMRAVYNAVGAK